MKHLLHTAIFTVCLCASLFCQAQSSETLLDENFDDGQFDTKALSTEYLDELNIVSNSGAKGNFHLEIVTPIHPNSFPHPPSSLIYMNDDALQYDSVEATFLLDPDLVEHKYDSVTNYGNGQFKFYASSEYTFSYKDYSQNKAFFKSINIVNSLFIEPGEAKTIEYNSDKKLLKLKWGKQTIHTLLENHKLTQYIDQGCFNTSGFNFEDIRDCFCNMTTNPTDCKKKVFQPPFPQLNFGIDNLVIKGFNKTITGLGDATETPLKEKHIVKSVDFLGREIPDLANYKGPAIIMFSDGSREKRVF